LAHLLTKLSAETQGGTISNNIEQNPAAAGAI